MKRFITPEPIPLPTSYGANLASYRAAQRRKRNAVLLTLGSIGLGLIVLAIQELPKFKH